MKVKNMLAGIVVFASLIGLFILAIRLVQIAVMKVFLIDFSFQQAAWLWILRVMLLGPTPLGSSD